MKRMPPLAVGRWLRRVVQATALAGWAWSFACTPGSTQRSGVGLPTNPAATTSKDSTHCEEARDALAAIKARLGRGETYRASLLLSDDLACVELSAELSRTSLQVLWELRDLPKLKALAESPTLKDFQPARDAIERMKRYRSADDLDVEARARFDALVELIARANAEEAWPKALGLVDQALSFAESGELLFEAGRAKFGIGKASESRRLWDAAVTLLDRELGSPPAQGTFFLNGIYTTDWATQERLWLGEWLYDRTRRRITAHAPRDRDAPKVFAAAEDWVFHGRDLWSVRTGRRIAQITSAAAATPSPDGKALYVLSQDSLSLYSPTDGKELQRFGPISRSRLRRANISVAPPGPIIIIDDWDGVKIFDQSRLTFLPKRFPRAPTARALANGWMVATQDEGILATHLESAKTVSYLWRAPPNQTGEPLVSRDGSRLLIDELIPQETLVFSAPDKTSRKLEIVARFNTDMGADVSGSVITLVFRNLSPDGALASAVTDIRHNTVWIFDTRTAERVESFGVSHMNGKPLCLFGIRVYPWELCRTRLER